MHKRGNNINDHNNKYRRLQYVSIMEYYSILKGNVILMHATI